MFWIHDHQKDSVLPNKISHIFHKTKLFIFVTTVKLKTLKKIIKDGK